MAIIESLNDAKPSTFQILVVLNATSAAFLVWLSSQI
jgi:hypothetical protein